MWGYEEQMCSEIAEACQVARMPRAARMSSWCLWEISTSVILTVSHRIKPLDMMESFQELFLIRYTEVPTREGTTLDNLLRNETVWLTDSGGALWD